MQQVLLFPSVWNTTVGCVPWSAGWVAGVSLNESTETTGRRVEKYCDSCFEDGKGADALGCRCVLCIFGYLFINMDLLDARVEVCSVGS